MKYQRGTVTTPAAALARGRDVVRAELDELARVRAAAAAERAKIQRARELNNANQSYVRSLRPKTYAPSAEAIAYRDAHLEQIQAMPEPLYGGPDNLRLAAYEGVAWENARTSPWTAT